MSNVARRFAMIFISLVALVAFGTLAFWFFEKLDPFNSLYLTITIVSTVGFGDITPHTLAGKIIYMGLVLTGIGIFGYAVSSIAAIMAERSIFKMVKGFLFLRGEAKLKDHVIVVGWNEITRSVCDELRSNGYRVVVLVEDDNAAREVSGAGYEAVVGSPLDASIYEMAKIDRANSVILALNDDSRNLMATLRIRDLSRDVKVIAICNNDFMKNLFYRAGANEVVNVADIGGRVLASHVFEPIVANVLEDMAEADVGLDAEQVSFQAGRALPIKELRSKGFKSLILLVVRGSQKFYYPDGDFELKPGDILVLIGLREHLDSDKQLLASL